MSARNSHNVFDRVTDDVLHILSSSQTDEQAKLAWANAKALHTYLQGNAVFVDTRACTARLATALEAVSEQPEADCRLNKRVSELIRVQAALPNAVALLKKLRAHDPRIGPVASFARLAARTTEVRTRCKLSKAWNSAQAADYLDVATCLDDVARQRRELDTERVRSDASMDLSGVDALLEACLNTAEEMASEIRRDGPQRVNNIADHYYLVGCVLRPKREPRVRFMDVLHTLDSLCQSVTGCRLGGNGEPGTNITVLSGGRTIGEIALDVAGTNTTALPAGNTLPTGRILVRGHDAALKTLSYASLKTVFHEFGHALAHILSTDVGLASDTKRLNILPRERHELLSTWFERQLLRNDVTAKIGLDITSTQIHKVRQRLLIETVRVFGEACVVAYLDLALHEQGRTEKTQAILSELTVRFPSLQQRPTMDFVSAMTHFDFLAHPGMGYIFPLADAFAFEVMAENPAFRADRLRPAHDSGVHLPPPSLAEMTITLRNLQPRSLKE